MTVKDVFELRKAGQVEEAYRAILPMYKVHHGHYTTMCMFWCGCDMAKLQTGRGDHKEARRILQSLVRLYPGLDDKDLSARQSLLNIAMQLARADASFPLLDFMQWWGMENLTDADFEPVQSNGHPLPSRGQRIATRLFREARAADDCGRMKLALAYVDLALGHTPRNRNLKRSRAWLLAATGEKQQAETVYRELARYGKEAYVFSELAELTGDTAEKIALTCKAVMLQRNEAFRQKDRLRLAVLLQDLRPRHARYELDRCVRARETDKRHNNRLVSALLRKLQDVVPASDREQQDFYQKAAGYLATPPVT